MWNMWLDDCIVLFIVIALMKWLRKEFFKRDIEGRGTELVSRKKSLWKILDRFFRNHF